MRADGLILVTGGTGGLGRRVVPRLREAGREVRVLSRRTHDCTDGIEYVLGHLAKDEGVEAAVEGAEVVVHCAGSPRMKKMWHRPATSCGPRSGRGCGTC